MTTREPIDVSRLTRADIEQRDWTRVMIDGDRNKPLVFGFRPKRIWRA